MRRTWDGGRVSVVIRQMLWAWVIVTSWMGASGWPSAYPVPAAASIRAASRTESLGCIAGEVGPAPLSQVVQDGGRVGSSTNPSRKALTTAWVRSDTANLRSTLLTWLFTVSVETVKASAIC